jgi:hypothetical protein
MSQESGQGTNAAKQDLVSSTDLSNNAKSNLTKLAAWISERNIPFLLKDVISLGVSLYLISYFGKRAILSENKK